MGGKYSKACLMWTQAYADTPPTVDKILCTDRFLPVYPLICGQTCHAWTVDTKKCTVEQNYLLLHGHLAVTSGDAVVVLGWNYIEANAKISLIFATTQYKHATRKSM